MTAEELHQEIEQTRQRLGETVDELAAKTDIKVRGAGQGGRGVRTGAAEPAGAAPLAGGTRRQGIIIAGAVAIRCWKKS